MASFWMWGWGFIGVKQCMSVSFLKALLMLWVFPQEGLWSVASCVYVFPPMRVQIILFKAVLLLHSCFDLLFAFLLYTLHWGSLCCVFHVKHKSSSSCCFALIISSLQRPVENIRLMDGVTIGSFLVGRSTCGLDTDAKFRYKQREKAHHTVNAVLGDFTKSNGVMMKLFYL